VPALTVSTLGVVTIVAYGVAYYSYGVLIDPLRAALGGDRAGQRIDVRLIERPDVVGDVNAIDSDGACLAVDRSLWGGHVTLLGVGGPR
jgi:hypothetical protein